MTFARAVLTTRATGRMLVALYWPDSSPAARYAFREFSMREGDYRHGRGGLHSIDVAGERVRARLRRLRRRPAGGRMHRLTDPPSARSHRARDAAQQIECRSDPCWHTPTIAGISLLCSAAGAFRVPPRMGSTMIEVRSGQKAHRSIHAQRPACFGRSRAAHAARRFPAPCAAARRHPCRLRARHLRRLHRAGRRPRGAIVPALCRAGRRLRDHTVEGLNAASAIR